MSIAVLADTTQIARLVVPKALLLQSAQVVQSRIGGLVGREIRHIPFSRRTPSTDEILRLYRDLHKQIREESGVLLTTSDHMLSFKLSGLQRLVDSKTSEAETMIRFQETLTRFSRDVIDESDFTLAVKTQLIYPVSSTHPNIAFISNSTFSTVFLFLYPLKGRMNDSFLLDCLAPIPSFRGFPSNGVLPDAIRSATTPPWQKPILTYTDWC